MNESWSRIAEYLARYRGSLIGALGAPAAVALTFDSRTGLATTAAHFGLWFAVIATAAAAGLTAAIRIAEHRATVPLLPRATARVRAT
jgi:hypothetical protein